MNLNALLQSLSHKSLVLTPNRRLSTFIKHKYNEHQKQSQQVWPSIQAMPLNEWLKDKFNGLFSQSSLVLSTEQLKQVWISIIESDSLNKELLKAEATAQHAIEAMRLLTLWDIPFPLLENYSKTIDSQQFVSWYKKYRDLCKQYNYTDQYHLTRTLLDYFNTEISQSDLLPKVIFMLGFDELPPLIQSIINILSKLTCIKFVDLVHEKQSIESFKFNQFSEELQAMARWAKDEITKNPNQEIACIVPSLASARYEIEKTFTKVFSEKTFLNLSDSTHFPFNISAGEPLASHTIIQAALQIIQYKPHNIPIETIVFFLTSPFIIGFYKELTKRTKLASKIQSFQQYTISEKQFVNLLNQHCPLLAIHFKKFIDLKPLSNNITDLLNFFNQRLEALGWPGDKELSSKNFQLISRFKLLFSEVLQLEQVNYTKITLASVQKNLKRLALQTLFQIRTDVKPIQVLGVLEAAGMIFDKLWLMELTDDKWPSSISPNPFIPYDLQKKYRLPQATPERELLFSEQIISRFLKSAKEVNLSFSTESEGQELNCSPLIKQFPLSICHYDEQSDNASYGQYNIDIEGLYDYKAPELTEGQLKNIKGGTQIFSLQAACPFKAFATIRLKAKANPLPQPGLTALQRGSIIHAVLDLFWQQVKSQAELNTLSDEQVDIIKTNCTQAAILSIQNQTAAINSRLFAIELSRIKSLLSHWLELEKKRDCFTVIATEEKLETTFNTIPLTLRIDRVDSLENGALILMDYKTSITSTSRWFGERLDEPQLPLYALIYPEEIDGIVFGQIRANNLIIKGIGSFDASGYGIKDLSKLSTSHSNCWQEQKKQWQLDLAQLANSFIKGDAEVNPKNGSQTCNLCELASLCRIGEMHD